MSQVDREKLLELNAKNNTAHAAVRQLLGYLWSPDEGNYCLKFARMAVEVGNGLPNCSMYGLAPGIHTGRYAGDVGDAFYRMGWAVASPQIGDLVFQRGLKSEMGGHGALVSAPYGHVGVVIVWDGELWVAENTTALNRGMWVATRADVAKNNRMTRLDDWGSYVAIRIPPEKINSENKPKPQPEAPKMSVWVDGVDVTGRRVVYANGLVVNAENPQKVQIRTVEAQK